jgi:hypothetical protein
MIASRRRKITKFSGQAEFFVEVMQLQSAASKAAVGRSPRRNRGRIRDPARLVDRRRKSVAASRAGYGDTSGSTPWGCPIMDYRKPEVMTAAERHLHGPGLRAIVHLGRRAVVGEVADGLRGQAGLAERHRHRAGGLLARFVETDPVMRVAGRAVPGDLPVRAGPPRLRPLGFLDDEHPRALAQDETVAIGGEGPRGGGRGVVANGRNDAHQNEPLHDSPDDGGVDAAHQKTSPSPCVAGTHARASVEGASVVIPRRPLNPFHRQLRGHRTDRPVEIVCRGLSHWPV